MENWWGKLRWKGKITSWIYKWNKKNIIIINRCWWIAKREAKKGILIEDRIERKIINKSRK